jgi:serine/threonine protein kinase
MDGGAIYGKGKYGTVYDTGCLDKKSLCYMLVSIINNIAQLRLITTNGKTIVVKGATDIMHFITAIADRDDIVTKQLGPDSYRAFQTEIDQYLKIIEIFDSNIVKKYMAVCELRFRKEAVIGFSYTTKNGVGNNTSFIFNYRCTDTFADRLSTIKPSETDILIQQVLELLIELDKREYYHADIKHDNIMMCHDRWKLIDWGHGIHLSEIRDAYINRTAKPYGSTIYVTPIQIWLYQKEIKSYTWQQQMVYYTYFFYKKMPWSLTDFNKFWDTMQEWVFKPQIRLLRGSPRELDVFEKYRRTFDLSSFGILLLTLFIYRRYPKKYFSFAQSILDIDDTAYCWNPSQALARFKRTVLQTSN